MKSPWKWDECEKVNGPAMVAFLRSVSGTRISEEDFVERFVHVSDHGKSKGHQGRRSPSRGRQVYRKLYQNYDFFV